MTTTDPLAHLPRGTFGCIVADPPWHFKTFSEKGQGKGASQHYPTMSIDQIKALQVSDLAAKDACLLLWTTMNFVPVALDVMDAWGFQFVSEGAWGKQTKDRKGWTLGTGFWLRSQAEFFLLGTRGKPRPRSHSCTNLIVAPRGEHSTKPEQLCAVAEALCPGPYCELFARSPRPGWSSWVRPWVGSVKPAGARALARNGERQLLP